MPTPEQIEAMKAENEAIKQAIREADAAAKQVQVKIQQSGQPRDTGRSSG